jgi:hypothetical protein
MIPQISFDKLSALLAEHQRLTKIVFVNTLDKIIYTHFMAWSLLDPEKHHSLISSQDWIDEYAEFDCVHEIDWFPSLYYTEERR